MKVTRQPTSSERQDHQKTVVLGHRRTRYILALREALLLENMGVFSKQAMADLRRLLLLIEATGKTTEAKSRR